MGQCHWKDCTNPATKVVYRMTTDEEREQSTHRSEKGIGWTAMLEREVCDEHLEEAQKIYPHTANKEPS
jgi:hypothetical protein